MALYLTNTFAPAVVPQPDEYLAKESARVYLEKLAERVSPGAKLLPFGSMANGFALKNSDMDLCCFLAKDAPMRPASELVQVLGSLIEQETNFHVKMLPRARIPIIKLTMPPTATVPFGMACDIGFENRLALENTRLLLTYAMVDTRLRTLVLFLKVWTKRRKINNPYRGTLSSYGFVLLVIHFLAQVKQPPVLPNLQQLPPLRPVPLEEQEFEGHDISFFDDLEALPRVWQTSNGDNVGELLIDFFRYYSKDFGYNSTVISIRSETGWLTKESKGWLQDVDYDPEVIVRDQHKLCIEDPFQLDYNVARTVTRDGLYTIRGEFMRAYRLLSARPNDRIAAVINDVCEEREDYLVHHPPTDHRASPRRRSAPSPRMFPNPALGLPHPPPLAPSASGTSPGSNQATMQDFRMWAAMNGVQQSQGQGQQGQGLGMGGMDARIFAREGAGMPEGSALEDTWDPTAPAPFPTASGSTYNPASASTSSTTASRRPAPSSRPQQLSTSPSSSSATSSSRPSQHIPPNPSSSSSVPSLERRVSWDGAASTSSAPNGNSLTTTGYDLHRFFQNQPGDSSSSSSASSTQQPPHGVEPRSALTAPSSPDLGSSSYYTNHGLGGTSYAPGRSSYRYGSGSGGGGFPIGPRMTSAPPSRNQHLGYHHSQQQHSHQHWSIAPAPIFPEEDREAIAMANSITFGNFPAPSYAGNGRASRGGAAVGGAAGGGGGGG
uniref:polynucleotide adenylyltransferase n=1 Tax=Leucosporidium scottii TaxID=5278 RepID=A0A0H5FUN1_9BASI|nr:hypothetical protein ls5931a1_00014 [Leucosporidium scottii]